MSGENLCEGNINTCKFYRQTIEISIYILPGKMLQEVNTWIIN